MLHTVGEDFVVVTAVNTWPTAPALQLQVHPNPIGSEAILQLKNQSLQNGDFLLYDLNGRLLQKQTFSGDAIHFDKTSLTKGLYFFEVKETGVLVGSGKLVFH